MISVDDFGGWIRVFGPYLGSIFIFIVIGCLILFFVYPDDFFNFFKANIVKIILIIIFSCILVGFFWFVDTTDQIESIVNKPCLKAISIFIVIGILFGIIWIMDSNLKSLGDKSVRVVISPYQQLGESSNKNQITYDIGTTELIRKEIEKNPNIDVKILDTYEAVTNNDAAKRISDKYNADIVIFGKSIDAMGEFKGLETSIFFSEKIKKMNRIQATSGIKDAMSGFDLYTIHDNQDISKFKGQIKDVVNLIFGLEKYFSENYPDSLVFFSNVSDSSLNSEFYVYKGYSQLKQNLFNESLISYDKAILLNSKNEFAWNDKGYLYQLMGKVNESMYFFDQSISINPDYPLSWLNKGNGYANLGNYEDALKCYSKPLEKYPDYYLSYNNLGTLELQKRNFSEAERNLNRAIEINPNSELAWINKGELNKQKGDFESALYCYDKGLSLNENYPVVWVIRGGILDELGRSEESIKSFDKSLSLSPNLDLAWYGKGITYFHSEKYDDAIKCFKQAIEINPLYYEAQNYLGMSYGQKKEYDLAEQSFIKAIEMNPDQTTAQKNLGYLFNISGKEKGYEIRVQVKNDTIILRKGD